MYVHLFTNACGLTYVTMYINTSDRTFCVSVESHVKEHNLLAREGVISASRGIMTTID